MSATPSINKSLQNLEEKEVLEAGDLITYFLEQIGVEYIFGIPGGAIEPLYNAMARSTRRGGIRPIVARHETSAAFMATGYAKQTGKLGVCCATTGPGATNLITGVADAYENNVPMLVITPQTPLPTLGRGAVQESSCTGVDTVGMFQYCTRYNSLVSHIDQLPHKLPAAIMNAFSLPMGPSHLSIPLDVQRQSTTVPPINLNLQKLLLRPAVADTETITAFYNEVENAKHIVIVIGECGEAVGAILKFAEIFNATIVTTPHGKGLIRADHPRYQGVIGFAGHVSAYKALTNPEVDLVIAVETNLGEFASKGWDEQALLNERLIHIDSVEANLTRSPMARLHVMGDVLSTFKNVLEIGHKQGKLITQNITTIFPPLKPSYTLDNEEKFHSKDTPIKPQRLMKDLTRLFPANTRYFADTGNALVWAIHYLQPMDRRTNYRRGIKSGLFRTCVEFAPMGWAIGASIGAAVGFRDGPIVCITGDGSFMMLGQDISTAIAENLNIIFVILNDSAFGMVKHGQRLAGAEKIAYELPFTDFCALAKAMGANGIVINSPEDMENLDIKEICKLNGPIVLDVRIDVEEVPPMQMRVEGLNKT